LTIPAQYQKLVAAECTADTTRDLDLYWDEETREYVCSRGQANSLTREIPDPRYYRSKYLDELALVRKPSSVFKVNEATPLHPCLKEFAIKRRFNPDLDPGMIRKLATAKQSEIYQLGITADQWSGEKRDVGSIFAALMKGKGFRRWKRSFVKEATSGLIFGGFADLGGRPFCINVPFHFFIAEDSDMIEIFELSFWPVVPGFWFYYGFDRIESGLLGFRAHVEMIDIMSQSFDPL
jgi:hypothetical protein